MRRFGCVLFAVMCILYLLACRPEFNGSRTGNDHELIMDFRILNKEDSQQFDLQGGDTIHAEIEVDSGTLAVTIGREDEEPIYENNEITADTVFDLTISEGGTYTVRVSGSEAKGGVRFSVIAPESIFQPSRQSRKRHQFSTLCSIT